MSQTNDQGKTESTAARVLGELRRSLFVVANRLITDRLKPCSDLRSQGVKWQTFSSLRKASSLLAACFHLSSVLFQ
jgi:hypothetical protein